jgi:hypothetical protein
MAKVIKYKFLSAEINHSTEENPIIEQILSDAEIVCETQEIFDANYPMAESEAVGDIIVEGEFEQEQPTQLDVIEAQVAYTAMMTDTLLEV